LNGAITIEKANLIATADNQSRTYGSPNPEFTISYTGFKNDDNATGLDTAPTISSMANPSSSVGQYDITLSGGVDNNYSFTLNNGYLDITKALLVVKADDKVIECCFTFPTLSATITGFVNGDTRNSMVSGGPSFNISGNFNWAGIYTIVPK
jgi:hypothetical protein